MIEDTEPRWRIEQHIGTIMQIIVVALLGWSLKTNVELTTQMGIVQSRLDQLQTTMNQGTNDRYRGSDAAKDFSAVWSEFQRREVRISRLEDQVIELQKYLKK